MSHTQTPALLRRMLELLNDEWERTSALNNEDGAYDDQLREYRLASESLLRRIEAAGHPGSQGEVWDEWDEWGCEDSPFWDDYYHSSSY